MNNQSQNSSYNFERGDYMLEILFATGNETKGKRFQKGLLKNNIKTLTLKDINLDLNVEENGKDVIENAAIKARECYGLTNKACMGMDDSMYLEGVPDDIQPGLFARRVNDKRLNDQEMLDYYISLVKKYGIDGKLNVKLIYGLVVINNEGKEFSYTWEINNIYMVGTMSNIIEPGYPLNSITKYKGINKYISEASEEDKEKVKVDERNVIDFIVKSIKG